MLLRLIPLLLVFTFFTQVQAQDKLSADLMMKIPRIAEPAISPDGKNVIYTERIVSVEENKSKPTLKISNMAGQSTIIEVGAFSAQWLNATKIAYMASADNGVQLWEKDVVSGKKTKITNRTDGISGYGYSPDGKKIWYSADVKVNESVVDLNPDLPKTGGAKLMDGLMYRHWTAWDDGHFSHVFIADRTDSLVSNEKDIMSREPFHSPQRPFGGSEEISFSADGKYLAYTSKKLKGTASAVSTNADIYLYNIATGTTENVTTFNKGYDVQPKFSKDGKYMIWLSMARDGYEADKNRLMLMDLTTKKVVDLSADFDNNVDDAQWDPSAPNKIIFNAGVKATMQLHTLTFDSALKPTIKAITFDVADYQSFSTTVVNGKTKIVASRMSMSSPTELYEVDATSGKSTQITSALKSSLPDVKMGNVEKRMVKATDGKEILTWVVYPPDFDPNKKYPALLYCQGGPQSTVSQFFSYRWNLQLMAAKGYIVVAPNRRGLPSFGQEWNEQVSGDWGGQAMKDLLSAIDDVAKEPYVDADALGAVGASFGGYSVYWLAGNHNKRFKSFISHCGVFNLESMYGTTEEMFFINHDLGGPYWNNNNAESYKKHSPHNYVQNWDTPILVIHNELDFRVPVSQGMEAFNAAQLRGIPSKFLYFPDEGHWVNKPQNSLLWNRVFFEFLDTHLKKP